MPSVAINPPKTPVTAGSNGIAAATIPNVCKMPGPPAPFVPTPLPNIGKSGDSPKDYSQEVKIEGKAVAIKGASFGSMGDAASKGTGGGLVSANTHGPTTFVGPGSMDVKIEGKNVQLLSDPMLNNCGGSGSPANAATLMGLAQPPRSVAPPGAGDLKCPHTNMWRSPPSEDQARRDDLESRKQADIKRASFGNWVIRQMNKGRAGMAGALNACEGSAVNAATAEFEQKVASDTNAREASVRYRCLDCGMEGDIDVVTDGGVIKECKISSSAASLSQVNKLRSAAAVLFPGAPVHLALPAAEAAGAKKWMKTPPNKVQSH